MATHPIEALLRPPVELYSAFVCGGVATCAMVAPWTMMMTPGVGYGTGLILGAFAYYRLKQGLFIVRYQRNIKRLRIYSVKPSDIKVSKYRMFLGLGFAWQPKHTQRLKDTLRPEAEYYVQPSALYQWARKKELAWEDHALLSHCVRYFRWDSPLNVVRPLPPVGGRPAIHAVEPNEQIIAMDISERVGHTLVLGTTRVGKTRLAELLITQDIHRGDVTIVFDPKGDADLMRRMYAEAARAGRDKEFYIFHLGYPEISARYNGVGHFSKITEVATRVSGQLSNEGNSAAFKEFGWRFVNIIAQALVKLGQRPDYHLITRYVINIETLFQRYVMHYLSHEFDFKKAGLDADFTKALIDKENKINPKDLPFSLKDRQKRTIAIIQYLKEHAIFEPVVDGLLSAVTYDKTYFDKIVASLLPLLEKLTTGKVAELIAPDYFNLDDKRPIFDWMQIIRKRGIVYIGLDALTDAVVSTAVGNSMFADLVSTAGQIYKHGIGDGLADVKQDSKRAISIHADEFNELMGDEFIPLLNKAGGAGVQATVYTQTWSDVEARIGSKAKAGQVAGNLNNMIMLRVKEYETAEMLTKQLPKVDIYSRTLVSGATDSSDVTTDVDFTSSTQDRISVTQVPMLEPSDIVSMPKGQAFALIEGAKLFKIRMPLPLKDDDPFLPKDLADMANRMESQYGLSYNSSWAYSPPIPTLSDSDVAKRIEDLELSKYIDWSMPDAAPSTGDE